MKYQVVIHWSAEDNAFIAEVPELPGSMADGPTKAKALRTVETIGGWHAQFSCAMLSGAGAPLSMASELALSEQPHSVSPHTHMLTKS